MCKAPRREKMRKDLGILAVLAVAIFTVCSAVPTFAAEATAKYKVRHYVQKNGASTYDQLYLDSLTGTVGSMTEAKPRELFGYEAETFYQEKISANGTTVVSIYYKRAYSTGDVNCDGSVDMLDMAYLERYVAGWSGYDTSKVCGYAADCKVDGGVNAKDILLLARHLAGIEDAEFGIAASKPSNKDDGFGPWI